MSKKLLLFTTGLFIAVSFLPARGQKTSILWAQHLDEHSTFVDVKPLNDGGFIAVGGINPLGSDPTTATALAGENAWMVRMDDTGGVIWQKSFGGSAFERFIQVMPTDDGGYMAAGHTRSADGDVTGNHGGLDIWIVKTNDTGAIEWSRCYGGSNHEQINTIHMAAGAPLMTNMMVATADGGFVIAGTTSSDDGDVSGFHGASHEKAENRGDIWLFKIDGKGALLWQQCIGGTMNEWVSSLLVTPDGGFIIGAVTSSSDNDAAGSGFNGGRHRLAEGGDYWVIRTDSMGDIEWQKCYGGSSLEITSGMIACTGGGYLLAGGSYSTDGDVSDQIAGLGTYIKPWLVRIDDTGGIVWDRSYWVDSSDNGFGTANEETTLGLIQNLDGTFNLIVSSPGFYGLVKVDSTGVVTSFNHKQDQNNVTRILQLSDGSYIGVGGYKVSYATRKSGSEIPRALILKYAACPAYSYVNAQICKGDDYASGGQLYTLAGLYRDTLETAGGCDSIVLLTLTVDSLEMPEITADGNTLGTSGAYTAYQWLDDEGNIIWDATAPTYEAVTAGGYRVVVTGAAGCSDTSGVYRHIPAGVSETVTLAGAGIYPNPVRDLVHIVMPYFDGSFTAAVMGIDGKEVGMHYLNGRKNSFSIAHLPAGVYFIRLNTEAGKNIWKIVKE